MAWAPPASAARVSDARPEARVTGDWALPSTVNVTWPVGVPEPLVGATKRLIAQDGSRLALRQTGSQRFGGTAGSGGDRIRQPVSVQIGHGDTVGRITAPFRQSECGWAAENAVPAIDINVQRAVQATRQRSGEHLDEIQMAVFVYVRHGQGRVVNGRAVAVVGGDVFQRRLQRAIAVAQQNEHLVPVQRGEHRDIRNSVSVEIRHHRR